MSGRDHSCEACGRGGMNDPSDAEISRLKAEVERLMREGDKACMKHADELLRFVDERDQARADLAAVANTARTLGDEVERLMKELDATQETLARYRRAGIEAEGEIQTLRRELEETQIVAEGHRDSNKILFRDNKEFLRLRDSAVSIAERAEHRANQCEAERDSLRAQKDRWFSAWKNSNAETERLHAERDQARAEVERLKGELEVTTIREKIYRTLTDRRGVRGDEAVALLGQARADLAAAQKREDARKAWREKYAERCETRGGDVQGCGTWIHYRDVLDAIGRGEGPK